MKHRISDLLKPVLMEVNDSEARLRLQPCHGAELMEVTGRLQGPHCADRRTLPATFPFQNGEVLVTEPCYWTPSQPFLYQLDVVLRSREGEVVEFSTRLGLRRWGVEGRNLMLERRRVVLRGAQVDAIGMELLAEARQAELVLLARKPSATVCEEASRLGVGLIVDLRGEDVREQLDRLQWFPAVLVALLDEQQLREVAAESYGLLLAGCVPQSPGVATPGLAPGADLLALSLSPNTYPPAEALQCNTPLLALRHTRPHLPIASARSACDHLQSELAPHCDLAGYVV